MPAQPVAFDINVLVGAVVKGNSEFTSWPSPPPVSDNRFADCLGIVNDAKEFVLVLSPHVLSNVGRVLGEGYGWQDEKIESYLTVLVEIVAAGGQGLFEPVVEVSDCKDFEDNRILELGLAAGVTLIVPGDDDLIQMSPLRGIPIIGPDEFSSRVDAARRSRRIGKRP
jgi:predicted nucleic acid-binding protein